MARSFRDVLADLQQFHDYDLMSKECERLRDEVAQLRGVAEQRQTEEVHEGHEGSECRPVKKPTTLPVPEADGEPKGSPRSSAVSANMVDSARESKGMEPITTPKSYPAISDTHEVGFMSSRASNHSMRSDVTAASRRKGWRRSASDVEFKTRVSFADMEPQLLDEVEGSLREAMMAKDLAVRQSSFRTTPTDKTVDEPNSHLGLASWLATPFRPGGFFIVAWSLLGACVLGYELVVTPLALIFEGQQVHLIGILDLVANTFWTLEILVYMRTAFLKQGGISSSSSSSGNGSDAGDLITDARSIMLQYARTWLAVDLLVVVPEWVLLISSSMASWTSGTSLSKVMRFPRMFRMLRLVRVVKLQRIIPNLNYMSRYASLKIQVFLRIIAWLVFTEVFVHVASCIWIALGKRSEGWMSHVELEQEAWLDQYIFALYWVHAHFGGTGGAWLAGPRTLPEQVFANTVTLTCTVLVVLFTSVTTNQIRQLARRSDYVKGLQPFILRHKVPYALGEQMAKVIEDESLFKEQEADDKMILDLLPNSCGKDVRAQVWGKCMAKESILFGFIRKKYKPFFGQMLLKAVHCEYAREADVVFKRGDACEVVRCVVSGKLQFRSRGPTESTESGWHPGAAVNSSSTSNLEKIRRGGWISEVRLWSTWRHAGELQTLTACVLLCVDPKLFQEVASQFSEECYALQLYASTCMRHVSESEEVSDVMFYLPTRIWEDEMWFGVRGTCRSMFGVSSQEKVAMPFKDCLPSHIDPCVCHAVVLTAQQVATHGLPEKNPHHGFTMIVGDVEALQTCGKSGFNILQGHHVCVINEDKSFNQHGFDILWRHAFHDDGAIVIDSRTGNVHAAGWFVGDINKGAQCTGGARSRSAKAIAQQAGSCFVVKCSEDSKGALVLHLGAKDAGLAEGVALFPLIGDVPHPFEEELQF